MRGRSEEVLPMTKADPVEGRPIAREMPDTLYRGKCRACGWETGLIDTYGFHASQGGAHAQATNNLASHLMSAHGKIEGVSIIRSVSVRAADVTSGPQIEGE